MVLVWTKWISNLVIQIFGRYLKSGFLLRSSTYQLYTPNIRFTSGAHGYQTKKKSFCVVRALLINSSDSKTTILSSTISLSITDMNHLTFTKSAAKCVGKGCLSWSIVWMGTGRSLGNFGTVYCCFCSCCFFTLHYHVISIVFVNTDIIVNGDKMFNVIYSFI